MIVVLLLAVVLVAAVWLLDAREPDKTCGCGRVMFCDKCQPEAFQPVTGLQIDTVRFPVGLHIDTEPLAKGAPPWTLDEAVTASGTPDVYRHDKRTASIDHGLQRAWPHHPTDHIGITAMSRDVCSHCGYWWPCPSERAR